MDKFDRKFIVAITLILFYLFAGTMFFHFAEGWSYVDSFYFSGTTLTTVGYGDLSPTQDFTKIATVLFMFSGIGIVLYSISIIGQRYFEREEERLQKIWEAAQERRDLSPTNELRRVAKRITTFNKERMLKGLQPPKRPAATAVQQKQD